MLEHKRYKCKWCKRWMHRQWKEDGWCIALNEHTGPEFFCAYYDEGAKGPFGAMQPDMIGFLKQSGYVETLNLSGGPSALADWLNTLWAEEKGNKCES